MTSTLTSSLLKSILAFYRIVRGLFFIGEVPGWNAGLETQ